MIRCNEEERLRCPKYQHAERTPVRDNHMRQSFSCVHSRSGWCEISEEVKEAYVLLEIQQGEACQIKKVRRLRGDKG